MKALLSRTAVELLEARVAPASFIVSTNADSGPGSLRQAIIDANEQAGPDAIGFSIPGVSVISLLSHLPPITDELSILAPGTQTRIDIDGTLASASSGQNNGSGLMLIGPGANGSSISGLAIYGFDIAGIELVDCTGVVVASNHLGIKANGDPATKRMTEGVLVVGGEANVIGTATGRNQIGGNEFGIRVTGSASDTKIDNNAIGRIPIAPFLTRPNDIGILIDGAGGTAIGGTTGNYIAANNDIGIKLTAGASNTTIERNLIGGFDSDGDWIGTQKWGIFVDGAKSTTIGSATANAPGSVNFTGNRISGNYAGGIWVHLGTEPIQILNNRIGTQLQGEGLPGDADRNLGNGGPGILVTQSTEFTSTPKITISSNLISANQGAAIELRGFENPMDAEVTKNLIGTEFLGKSKLPNGLGIVVDRADGVVIGGSGDLGNTIVASDGDGILVKYSTLVSIRGNHVGVSPFSGTIGNGGHGIHLVGVGIVHIGYQSSGITYGNAIGNNGADGIFIDGSKNPRLFNADIRIHGNRIGPNGVGVSGGNAGAGIHIEDFSNPSGQVRIGDGRTPPNSNRTGGGNSISGNLGDGILVESSRNVFIAGNHVGDNRGFFPPGNFGNGISIVDSDNISITGGVIVSNAGHGISISGQQGPGKIAIDGVNIGFNSDGTKPLANGLSGIVINGASGTFIGDNEINAADGQIALVIVNADETEIVDNHFVARETGLRLLEGESNLISHNRFTIDAGGMFIDLGDDGPTLNDRLDADSGPNTLLNSPYLLSAVIRDGQTLLRGEYRGAPNINVKIEYYVDGEFLTMLEIRTDENGIANLPLDLDTEVLQGSKINASATSEGSTSEFSADVTATTSREVIAKGSSPGQKPRVQLRDANTGEVIVDCLAFGRSLLSGVRVATADVDGDGIADLIATPRTGKPIVKVLSGLDGHEISSFNAGSGGRAIRSIAAGDLDGDGTIEIVVGRGGMRGGPVAIYDALTGVAEARYTPFGFNEPERLKLSLIDVDGDELPEIQVRGNVFGQMKTILLDPLTGGIEWVARATAR